MKTRICTHTTASGADLTGFIVHREAGALFDLAWKERIPALEGFLGNSLQPGTRAAGTLPDADEAEGADGEAAGPARRWVDARTVLYSAHWNKHLAAHEAAKTAIADLVKTALSLKAASLMIVLDGEAAHNGDLLEDLACALGIAAWRFETYRAKPSAVLENLECVLVTGGDATLDARIGAGLDMAVSVNLARALVNEPGSVMTPAVMAERAAAMAREEGLGVEILDRDGLVAGGYSGILAVGQGSRYEPRMVVLRYRPDAAARHVALVGKGISFDTGGISLKPGKDMHEMKSDMSGAAAVIGAMRTIARKKPNTAVTGILVCAENMIGSAAQRPGDIFRHKNGKYIQVDNTDAEGRLCLIDGLARAGEEGADTIVDIATLTGACIRALGTSLAGVLGNDDGLVSRLVACGERSGERLWPFPLLEEYAKELETPHADLRNIGGAYAGHITAALFMQPFVPKNAKWAHLDIAGPAYFEKGWKYYSPGATGFGTRLLADWVLGLAESGG